MFNQNLYSYSYQYEPADQIQFEIELTSNMTAKTDTKHGKKERYCCNCKQDYI